MENKINKTYGHLLTLEISQLIPKLEKPLTAIQFIDFFLLEIGVEKETLSFYEKKNLKRRVLKSLQFFARNGFIHLEKQKTQINTVYYLISKNQ